MTKHALPHLLEGLDRYDFFSSSDRQLAKKLKSKWNKENTESLKAIAEANKQALVLNLGEARKLSMQIIIIEDLIKVRQQLVRNGKTRKPKVP